MLLKVQCHQLGGAKVLHGFGNLEAVFFAEFEVRIDGVARGKNNGRIVRQIESLAAEFFGCKGLYKEKGMKLEGYTVLLLQRIVSVEVRGCFLGYQYLHSVHANISMPTGKISRAQRYKIVAKVPQRERKICPCLMRNSKKKTAHSAYKTALASVSGA